MQCVHYGRSGQDIVDAYHVIIIIAFTTIIQCVNFTYDLGPITYIAHILTYYLLSFITSLKHVNIGVRSSAFVLRKWVRGTIFSHVIFVYVTSTHIITRSLFQIGPFQFDGRYIVDLSKVRFMR